MRFLLYPQRVAVRNRTSVVATATASQLPSCRTNPNNNNNDAAPAAASQRSWGQQCSPACGCVVRFEHDAQQGGLFYTAKRVVTMTCSSSPLLESSSSPQSTQRVAVLTSKGRPMLTPCRCDRVHHLSQLLVQHYNTTTANNNSSSHAHAASSHNGDWKRRAVTDLEFQSNRSSRAFGQAVLTTQGFSPSAENEHCWNVVEEAWTALCKGYLPAPRRQRQLKRQVLETTTHTTRADPSDDDTSPLTAPRPSVRRPRVVNHNDDDEDHYYHDDNESSSSSSPLVESTKNAVLSTLTMFDWNQQQYEQEEERQRQEQEKQRQREKQQQFEQQQQQSSTNSGLTDWQAYVDHQFMMLQHEEQQEQEHQASSA